MWLEGLVACISCAWASSGLLVQIGCRGKTMKARRIEAQAPVCLALVSSTRQADRHRGPALNRSPHETSVHILWNLSLGNISVPNRTVPLVH